MTETVALTCCTTEYAGLIHLRVVTGKAPAIYNGQYVYSGIEAICGMSVSGDTGDTVATCAACIITAANGEFHAQTPTSLSNTEAASLAIDLKRVLVAAKAVVLKGEDFDETTDGCNCDQCMITPMIDTLRKALEEVGV